MRLIYAGLIVAFAAAAQVRNAPSSGLRRIDLAARAIQSSAKVAEKGAAISAAAFDTRGWHTARVPSTVVAALVGDRTYPDPHYDLNLRAIPGTTYDFGDNFAVDPIPAGSPFAVSWWYRTQVSLPPQPAGSRLWLNFDSIDYRANIRLNGALLADSNQVAGMYRGFEFDITDSVARGANTLAVEVFPPGERDLALSFIDWNPLPPDKNMGIVRSAYILCTGPVSPRNPQVVSQLDSTFEQAQLTLYADLTNGSGRALVGTLKASVGDIRAAKTVRLALGESTGISITPREAALTIAHPQLWWLLLHDADGKPAGSNFYWLSTQPDVFDWTADDYPYARLSTYADLTDLQKLPPARVAATWSSEPGDPDQMERVAVESLSSQLAFFVHLTVLKGKGGSDIAPVYWDDNYFELMPGEVKRVTASYPRKLLGGTASYIQVDGWNMSP